MMKKGSLFFKEKLILLGVQISFRRLTKVVTTSKIWLKLAQCLKGADFRRV